MRHTLKLHPDSRSHAVTAVTVDVRRRDDGTITLHYVLDGDMSRIAVPPRAIESRHVDELWKHTCFEIFAREPTGDGYVEFNFSPSTEYAAYSFTGYREGMDRISCSRLHVGVSSTQQRLELHASVPLACTPLHAESVLRLGISAIVEETDGTKSCWALAHPQGKPDFHHADSFVLDLPPPEQT